MINYKKADLSDLTIKSTLKDLWIECFGDEKKAADLFFDLSPDCLSGFYAECDGKIVSALYLIHGFLDGKKAHYMCGVSTLEQYRNRGIIRNLIEYSLNDAKKNGDVYSLLFPVNESLYPFYSKFGYAPLCTAKKCGISREELVNLNPPTEMSLHKQEKCFINRKEFISFSEKYYAVYGVKSVNTKNAFALIDESSECANVFYCDYTDFDELKELLLKNIDKNRFEFTVKSEDDIFVNSKKEIYGMIKSIGDTEIPDDVFIGITLN